MGKFFLGGQSMSNYERVLLEMQETISVLKERVGVLEKAMNSTAQEEVPELPTVSKKYRALSDFIIGSDEHELELSFTDIEDLLGFTLPPSARQHRAFWANAPSHAIASSWMSAGYETIRVNIELETIVFGEKRREHLGNDFEKLLYELILKAETIPTGKYTVKQIYGDEWVNNTPKAYRPSLGRLFYQHVASGKIKDMSAIGKDAFGVQLYAKGCETNEI